MRGKLSTSAARFLVFDGQSLSPVPHDAGDPPCHRPSAGTQFIQLSVESEFSPTELGVQSGEGKLALSPFMVRRNCKWQIVSHREWLIVIDPLARF